MLSFLIAVRNAVIVALLSWLGLQAPMNDEDNASVQDHAATMLISFR